MNRAQVLDAALDCITKTRQDQHGNPENTFADIAALWSNYLDAQISPAQVAWMMVLFKVARAKNNPLHVDNAVDAAGYAALAVELATAVLDAEAGTFPAIFDGGYEDDIDARTYAFAQRHNAIHPPVEGSEAASDVDFLHLLRRVIRMSCLTVETCPAGYQDVAEFLRQEAAKG